MRLLARARTPSRRVRRLGGSRSRIWNISPHRGSRPLETWAMIQKARGADAALAEETRPPAARRAVRKVPRREEAALASRRRPRPRVRFGRERRYPSRIEARPTYNSFDKRAWSPSAAIRGGASRAPSRRCAAPEARLCFTATSAQRGAEGVPTQPHASGGRLERVPSPSAKRSLRRW